MVILGAVTGSIVAPRFLLYHEKVPEADAVILFVGSDWEAREDEASRLMTEGYSRRLLIPLYHKYFPLAPVKVILRVRPTSQDVSIADANTKRNYPRYFENTHIELLEAKKMMDALGLKSAICVSSAYHLRRIKVMADAVFAGNGYRISFAPAKEVGREQKIWFLDRGQAAWVMSEYLKLLWFLLYGSAAQIR
jgi:hypothetical protein